MDLTASGPNWTFSCVEPQGQLTTEIHDNCNYGSMRHLQGRPMGTTEIMVVSIANEWSEAVSPQRQAGKYPINLSHAAILVCDTLYS